MFDVKVLGEPPPDITWYLGTKTIDSTSVRNIENVPNNIKFSHMNPTRKDTGVYKIQTTNKYGSDTAEVEVNVICKCNIFWLQSVTYTVFN